MDQDGKVFLGILAVLFVIVIVAAAVLEIVESIPGWGWVVIALGMLGVLAVWIKAKG